MERQEEQNHDFFKEKKDHTRAQTSGREGEKLKSYFKSLYAAVAACRDTYRKTYGFLLSKKKHTRQTMYF